MHTSGQPRPSQLDRQTRRSWFRLELAVACLCVTLLATNAEAKGKKKAEEPPPAPAAEAEPSAPADEGPTCFTYANMAGTTAGILQIPFNPTTDGTGQRGFDGFPVVIKLANERARTCRIEASLKLADKMMATYEVLPAQRTGTCLLLVELSSKTAILRDRRGICGPALCGEVQLNGFTMTFDPKRKTCMKPPEATGSQ